MSNGSLNWLKLYTSTAVDPKFRLVARESGQPVANVLAVWIAMLCHAGDRADDERGSLTGWMDGLASVALDLPTNVVSGIRGAMEDLLLREGRIIAWERRQSSSSSAERVRAHRERKRAGAGTEQEPGGVMVTPVTLVTVTPVTETPVTGRLEEKREEKIREEVRKEESKQERVRASDGQAAPRVFDAETGEVLDPHAPAAAAKPHRIPATWQPTVALLRFAEDSGYGREIAEAFLDYWTAESGPRAKKQDWDAAFKTWVRMEAKRRSGGSYGGTARETSHDRRRESLKVFSDIIGHGEFPL